MTFKSKITQRQKEVFSVWRKTESITKTAKHFGIGETNVNKNIVCYYLNLAKDHNLKVPSIDDVMLNKGEKVSPILRAFDFIKNINGITELPEAFSFEDHKDPIPVFATGEKLLKKRFIPLPKKGIDTYLLMGIQDGTPIHESFWNKLNLYKDFLSKYGNSQIMCGPLLYNKGMFGDPSKQERLFLSPREIHYLDQQQIKNTVFFDSKAEGLIFDETIDIGGVVEFCPEVNIIVTAAKPLSGLETHTSEKWGIFAHTKQHLESIPRMPYKYPKVNMSTGVCTKPNYIGKKAGRKAEFHHIIGFVIIEVIPDGRFWCRHIQADPETGDFKDLDITVDDKGVKSDSRVMSLSYGDVHREKLDRNVGLTTWGFDVNTNKNDKKALKNSLLEKLKPEYQFFHDVSDFAPRNHHNIKDPHFMMINHFSKTDNVEKALENVAVFLKETKRPYSKSIVIQSNHDNALLRWCKEGKGDKDPENAEFWHWSNYQIAKNIREKGQIPNIFELALKKNVSEIENIEFIGENDGYELKNIVHQHGHLGPNGSRGGINNLFKVAEKMTVGHGHSPHKRDGLVMAGVCNLDQGYNVGPTGWAICHAVEHTDGSRQLIFDNGNQFYARQYL